MPETIEALSAMLLNSATIGIIISIVAEKLDTFQQLTSTIKFWIITILCIIIPVSGKILTELPPNILDTLNDWYPVVATGIVALAINQGWHKLFNK